MFFEDEFELKIDPKLSRYQKVYQILAQGISEEELIAIFSTPSDARAATEEELQAYKTSLRMNLINSSN